jgi:type I restriction enzyme M protein
MRATASTDEIERFRLCVGDVLITKDSEAWDDIGVPSLVEDPASDPLRGLFSATLAGKPAVVEYEPDSDLRDTEQVPLLEEGGIEASLRREVLPHAADAWYVPDSVKTGYEISFTRYFYKPQPLRTLEEIRADILALQQETNGLLDEIIGGTS